MGPIAYFKRWCEIEFGGVRGYFRVALMVIGIYAAIVLALLGLYTVLS